MKEIASLFRLLGEFGKKYPQLLLRMVLKTNFLCIVAIIKFTINVCISSKQCDSRCEDVHGMSFIYIKNKLGPKLCSGAHPTRKRSTCYVSLLSVC